MENYIESLEQAGVKMTAPAWWAWIESEREDLKRQGATDDTTNIDISRIIDRLEADGYVADYTDEATALLESAPLDTIAEYMDDDIREDVHNLLSPCPDGIFLAEYLSRHVDKYDELLTI